MNRLSFLWRLFRPICAILLIFTWYSAVSVYIFSYRSDKNSADAAIILGAAAWGERPSPIFRERINHAIQLYQQGQVRKLIFTGGVGTRSSYPESEIAKRYAISQGVNSADILIETQSTNTLENLRYAQEVAKENDLHTFVIVSSPVHMRRALLIAERIGMTAYSSPTRTTPPLRKGTKEYMAFRELIGFGYYIIFFHGNR